MDLSRILSTVSGCPEFSEVYSLLRTRFDGGNYGIGTVRRNGNNKTNSRHHQIFVYGNYFMCSSVA